MTYTTKKQNNLLFITDGEQDYSVSACDVLEKIRERVLPYREVKLMYEVRTKRDEFIYLDSMPGYQQGHFHGCIDGYQKALSENGFGESDCCDFAEWMIGNYVRVDSEHLNKWAWVNFRTDKVLANGSDHHYTTLIKEKGKTTQELFSEWKEIRAIGLIGEGIKVELEMEKQNCACQTDESVKCIYPDCENPKPTDGKVTVIRIL